MLSNILGRDRSRPAAARGRPRSIARIYRRRSRKAGGPFTPTSSPQLARRRIEQALRQGVLLEGVAIRVTGLEGRGGGA
ncbi:MAG: hypothetical protein KIS78_05115 [Labilithrix sp.]|nr:hypothetical protein [Labilithrix sp.]